VLLEGVPGLAKTLTVRRSRRPSTRFAAHPVHARPAARRPHRHADLQPADGRVLDRKGPIFANIILADEINRAPAKVQSALLEAMQERQVTIGDRPSPAEAVPRAGHAEPDRAGGHLPAARGAGRPLHAEAAVGYPSREEEREILDRMARRPPKPAPRIVSSRMNIRARAVVDDLHRRQDQASTSSTSSSPRASPSALQARAREPTSATAPRRARRSP
jgi:MoxR-like ATPase